MIDDDLLTPRERYLLTIANSLLYIGLASMGVGIVVIACSLIFTGA